MAYTERIQINIRTEQLPETVIFLFLKYVHLDVV